MKTTLKQLALMAFSVFAIASHADTGIASGQPAGTYYPMAQNIADSCSKPNNKINNVPSDGSLDNIFKIYSDKNAQFGIVQLDALVYQQGLDEKMMSRIVVVFPFFSDEIHLIVKDGSNIKSLADLQGKKVVEGSEGTGTWVTTQVIKATTGMSWTPVGTTLTQADGLKAVKDGEADAVFIVAGKPMKLLKDAKGVKLISTVHPKLDNFKYYTRTMLSTGTYSFQPTSVQTYKVANVLATFAYKNQFQGEISDLVTCIAKNIDTFQTDPKYHPKWKDVDPLDIDRVGWTVHPAAIVAIKKNSKVQ